MSTIYLYDYYVGSYDDIALYDSGSGYAYGVDDQGQYIYYGSDYYSPDYVFDSSEAAYFAYDSNIGAYVDYTANASYIYIYDYYVGSYDDILLTDSGSGYAYGVDDQGQYIYYGSGYYSPDYIFDSSEAAYFAYDSNIGAYVDYTANASYIYIYDYYVGSYDDILLTDSGSGYAYGVDDQGQYIYYGSDYYSPDYVFDSSEAAYFAYDSNVGAYVDYTANSSIYPSALYIYDATSGFYDDVLLYDSGSGFAYGVDDQGQYIYYGSSYYSPDYVFDGSEAAYFAYDSNVGAYVDYSASV